MGQDKAISIKTFEDKIRTATLDYETLLLKYE